MTRRSLLSILPFVGPAAATRTITRRDPSVFNDLPPGRYYYVCGEPGQPLHDVQEDIRAVQLGLRSRSAIIRERPESYPLLAALEGITPRL